jgi:hypothetical protein
MPGLSDLEAIWSALIFGGIVGGAWLGGRSKYRDKLIADLQSHNNLLQDDNHRLSRENEVLRNGFKEDVIAGVLEGLK